MRIIQNYYWIMTKKCAPQIIKIKNSKRICKNYLCTLNTKKNFSYVHRLLKILDKEPFHIFKLRKN